MCGRFALSYKYFEKLLKEMGAQIPPKESFQPHYNIAPGHKHWMLYKDHAALIATKAVWGISPSWMKPGQLLFNAKIETALEKPTFKRAYTLHRCVIPINGFFEWVKEGEIKQPYFFHRMNEEVFFLAGIYYVEDQIQKFVVMTTDANEWMRPYHSRMPIVLTSKNYGQWLTTKALMDKTSFETVETLLELRKVSTRVNSARLDDPECIQAVS